jgi:hypothetical protein
MPITNETLHVLIGVLVVIPIVVLVVRYFSNMTPEKIVHISKSIGICSSVTASVFIKNDNIRSAIIKAVRDIKVIVPEPDTPINVTVRKALETILKGLNLNETDYSLASLILDIVSDGLMFLSTQKISDLHKDVTSYILVTQAFLDGFLYVFDPSVKSVFVVDQRVASEYQVWVRNRSGLPIE